MFYGDKTQLRPDAEDCIMQKFRLDWNFHSNNIEGNQLTFGETKTFLLHGITADKKPLKDHLDIKGHNEALLYLESIVHKDDPITEVFIRGLHEVILKEPYENPAISPDGKIVKRKINIGQYKSKANHVITATGETFYFASPEETSAKMHDLIKWYREEEEKAELHPLELAAQFHYSFIRIHPFDDGNGRMARILMNLILMRNGFPPVVVKTQDKDNYFKALRGADGGDVEIFEGYIAGNLVDSLELFLLGAKGKDISEFNDLDKELDLFIRELTNKKNDNLLEKSNKLIRERYSQSFKVLFQSLIQKLDKFDNLFNETKTSITILQNNKYKHLGNVFHQYDESIKLQDFFRKMSMSSKSWQNIRLKYNWGGFLQNDINPFDLSFELVIQFEEYKYKIEHEHLNKNIEKSYSQNLEEEEIINIIKDVFRGILETIKNKTIKD